MERISIFNYEAFYLDFLEGNLNEEDSALLLAFLEENPDLKMDDDELPSFNEESLTLDRPSKNDLKQYSEDEAVTIENIEFFMIANAEGLLTISKAKELAKVIAESSDLEKEKALFDTVYFEPDETIVFSEKDDLKKKEVVLWPYISFAAAASIIAFIMLWANNNAVDLLNPGKTVAETPEAQLPLDENGVSDELVVEDEYIIDNSYYPLDQLANNESYSPLEENPQLIAIDQEQNLANQEPVNRNLVPIDKMELRPIQPIIASVGNQELRGISLATYGNDIPEETPPTYDYATTAFAEMENPIEPLTQFIQDRTNTEVDFRHRKKTEDKPGGFFIKIGRFEISRKRH